ncbi:hypothetical protein [Solilutibacter silvestris]|uniref:hypothetical protein n=1 Tax=Solilutibacter silvestris TaxID=1645665 RepID=UPI00197BF492|nr:hypothetical protein [Lysobacter silvestris]
MIRGIADKFVELGLKDAGYRHIDIDDCWVNWGAMCRPARPCIPATPHPASHPLDSLIVKY